MSSASRQRSSSGMVCPRSIAACVRGRVRVRVGARAGARVGVGVGVRDRARARVRVRVRVRGRGRVGGRAACEASAAVSLTPP